MKRSNFLAWTMLALPLLFFAFQFILRSWPSLMINVIMQQFMIDATGFGLMASFYYYGYSSMQIPVALLLDKYGPRYIIAICALICGLANISFVYTDNFYIACAGRLLIGASSAAGFLGVSKVISQWFSKKDYARTVGFSFTFGLIGAIYGCRPISVVIRDYGWQKVATSLSITAIAIGALILLLLRTPKQTTHQESEVEKFTLPMFGKILGSPIIWTISISNLLMVGALEGFADVWGIQYLMTANNILREEAALVDSFIFVGMLFGGPILALLSEKFGNYTIITLSGLAMAVIFFAIFNGIEYNLYLYSALFFAIGVFCCYQVLIFAAGAELVSAAMLGVTIAFLNCINMLGGSFFHSIIGYLMDHFWTGNIDVSGTKIYTLESYQYALSVIPICTIIGSLLVWLVNHKTKKIIAPKHQITHENH